MVAAARTSGLRAAARARGIALALCLGAWLSPSARAASLTLLFDNDSFADTDHHYTCGMELLLALEEARLPAGLVRLGRALPFTEEGGAVEGSLGLGQDLFTPHEITWVAPPAEERPYAGWLYLRGGLAVRGERRWDRWDLSLGVVGPWALGEELQIWSHAWSDSRYPAGWSHQLDNEPGLILGYRRGWRLASGATPEGWGLDLLPTLGAQLDRGPPRIAPRINGSPRGGPHRGLGVQALLGLEGRLVGRNLFLDGNSLGEGPAVAKRWAVGTAEAGLVLSLGPAWLSYTHVLLSPEYRAQDGPDDYGSAALGASW
jgi:lipid A 3-O-deacylase